MSGNKLILSSAYFGPVQYFTKLANYSKVVIEQHDHYAKQTYRNRTVIFTANGPIALTVPVTKTGGNKTKLKDIRVFNQDNWQRLHLRTLKAAYQNSPFYEFYIDALMPVFENKWKFLMDLNCFTTDIIALEIEHPLPYKLSEEFLEAEKPNSDFREIISPKKDSLSLDKSFKSIPYHQVFGDRFPFQANLSILDLLFNKGPETIDLLKASQIY